MQRPDRDIFKEYKTENKILKNFKDNPLLGIAGTGLITLTIYHLRKIIKNRHDKTKLPISQQIINARMYAQGFFVATLTLGVLFAGSKKLYYYLISPKDSSLSEIIDKKNEKEN